MDRWSNAVCRGEEGAKRKGEALDLLVNLPTLGHDRKNMIQAAEMSFLHRVVGRSRTPKIHWVIGCRSTPQQSGAMHRVRGRKSGAKRK